MFLLGKSKELSDLANDFLQFEHALLNFADTLGLALKDHEIDHIALRCHQNTTAERWQRGLLQIGTLFSQKEINGRSVALFELAEPLTPGPCSISMIELPWPGERRYRHEGWEHIEIVLRGDASQLAARALALLSDEGLTRPGIAVKNSAPQGAGERLPNPTLAVTDGNITIKFHPWSLKEIVLSETN